ncbi:unnamed protein product [Clonostachys rosea]|uniref:Xylanolytic transcriptional activator regulatory domain-containing protein n=1 Tax=Bionectria ochroleuca TaxID=29856 RepID=A0ABY6U6Y7_BIOOC|nr:unnamed protein product [Clonostachys rosea]
MALQQLHHEEGCSFVPIPENIFADKLRHLNFALQRSIEADSSQKIASDSAEVLKSLGYVESDIFKSLEPIHSARQVPLLDARSQNALQSVPPRPYTDILVQTFFENVNYHYEPLYKPSFMRSYTEWWHNRRLGRQEVAVSDIAFTALVLQVCANATQFASSSLLERLESELGASIESLGCRYFEASNHLSSLIPVGEGGLVHVQQLFLSATWWKTQAEITKSWHALASSVREAQESGMHTGKASSASALEEELRRRMWYILCTWDTSMCIFFGRPLLIMHDSNLVPLPDPHLELSANTTMMPSPATVIALEYRLWVHLCQVGSTTNYGSSLGARVRFVQQWMSSLPDAFNLQRRDMKNEVHPPEAMFRSFRMQSMGYMALLGLLRPCLINQLHDESYISLQAELQMKAVEIISLAVDTAITLMSICRDFFAFCYPDQAKYFLVSFCPFDTASILCCALINDKSRKVISRRLDIVAAIGCAQYILGKLQKITKMGEATWSVLSKLVSQLDLSEEEKQVMEETHRNGQISAEANRPGLTNESTYVGGGLEPGEHTHSHCRDANPPTADSFLSNEDNVIVPDETLWYGGLDMACFESVQDLSCLEDIYNYHGAYSSSM